MVHICDCSLWKMIPRCFRSSSRGSRKAVFAVDHYADGAEGLTYALGEPYAAVVVDIMLPGLDGLKPHPGMRKHKVMTPVLILSAKATSMTG